MHYVSMLLKRELAVFSFKQIEKKNPFLSQLRLLHQTLEAYPVCFCFLFFNLLFHKKF